MSVSREDVKDATRFQHVLQSSTRLIYLGIACVSKTNKSTRRDLSDRREKLPDQSDRPCFVRVL